MSYGAQLAYGQTYPQPHGQPQAAGYSYPPSGYPVAGAAPPMGYPTGYHSYPSYGAPPGYPGFPTGYGAPPGYASHSYRDRSRSRGRRDSRRDDRDRGGGQGAQNQASARADTEHKQRMMKWLKGNKGWRSIWLEGIDPPKRPATAPNVTVMLLTRANQKKDGGEEFGFILGVSRMTAKKKDREKECAKELVLAAEKVPLENASAWCQFDSSSTCRQEVDQSDIDRLGSMVREKVPRVVVSLPEPTTFVLVSSQPWGPNEKQDGVDADLAVLELFESGYAELLQESRRVHGLVRKQWFIASVLAKLEPNDAFILGVGLAADSNLAKARAVYAAEIRTQVLTEAMLKKAA